MNTENWMLTTSGRRCLPLFYHLHRIVPKPKEGLRNGIGILYLASPYSTAQTRPLYERTWFPLSMPWRTILGLLQENRILRIADLLRVAVMEKFIVLVPILKTTDR